MTPGISSAAYSGASIIDACYRDPTSQGQHAMDADLLIELPGHQPGAVSRREFLPLLAVKGWHRVGPERWTSPTGAEPDTAFTYLSRSLMPRRPSCTAGRACGPLRDDLPMFRRRHDHGIDVWILD
jgi:hypothetical protein